ncbi:MAG: heme biosynthesis HemY N-terminal domain-containing protein [Pseudomonadota bacterium]|nr:heme biosynthesis HemY N-terminal domain-containing protein [Pseudomonadota bacterium]
MGVLILLLAVVLGMTALFAFVAQNDPGYVLVAVGGYRIETSFWAALAAIGLVLIAGWLLWKLVRGLGRGASRLGRTFSSDTKVAERMDRGIRALIGGDWRRAETELGRAGRGPKGSPAALLLAAWAADQGGREQDRDRLLADARECRPNDKSVGLMQVRLLLERGEQEAALAALAELRSQFGSDPVVLQLQARALSEVGDWTALEALLPQIRKQQRLPKEQWHRLQLDVFRQRAEALPRGNSGAALRLEAELPKALRFVPEVADPLAQALAAAGEHSRAERLLRDAINQRWSARLLDTYGRLEMPGADRRLLTAQNWLQSHPSDATLLVALGRLALHNHLWGKARHYFEASLQLQRTPEAAAELARLEVSLGGLEAGLEHYRLAAELLPGGLPALPMPQPESSERLSRP